MVYPICTSKRRISMFFIFHFGHFSVFQFPPSQPLVSFIAYLQNDIYVVRGRFDNCCCHLLHTSENTFKMIYTWSNCSSFTFEKNLAFPTGSNGVEVPTIIHWSTTLPNLPDAQDNKQHDVKRLNHGSLMLIIFSFRGRFDSFGR